MASRNANSDITLCTGATDTISALAWSPVANHLAAASWDGKMRIYDVLPSGKARGDGPGATLDARCPLFDCAWAQDGNLVVAGAADCQAHVMDVTTGQQGTIGVHDAAVRCVRFVEAPGSGIAGPIIATGSWDRTVRYWDVRQPQANPPLASLSCSDRVYAMDAKKETLIIATADRKIHIVDLRNPAKFLEVKDSPLNTQIRAVSLSSDGKIYGTATIGGRCSIDPILHEKETAKRDAIAFTFRCHRTSALPPSKKSTDVYTVNDIALNPLQPESIFATGGSDGNFTFWDRIAHRRVAAYDSVLATGGSGPTNGKSPSTPGPATAAITKIAFSNLPADQRAGNRSGSFIQARGFLAYAVGYDWSHGHTANRPDVENKLMIHQILSTDIATSTAR